MPAPGDLRIYLTVHVINRQSRNSFVWGHLEQKDLVWEVVKSRQQKSNRGQL